MKFHTNNLLASLMFGVTFALPSLASDVNIPNQFSAGTPAVAAEVNANFSAVKTAVDDNNSRVAQLEAELQAQQSAINSMQATLASLQATNAQLSNFVAEVLPYMTGGSDGQGHPAVFFSGANVHINNGEGSTRTVNGTGNLVVGYDETTTGLYASDQAFCTVAPPFDGSFTDPYDTQVDCEAAGGVWSEQVGQHKIGSHNVVIGFGHNYTQYGSLVSGDRNTAAGPQSTLTGGYINVLRGWNGVIMGGRRHLSDGLSSAITGGRFNHTIGQFSSITGGQANETNGLLSAVTGGFFNAANSAFSTVSGGSDNIASGNYSSVTGGFDNVASGRNSTVSGGNGRAATDLDDWAAGSLFENF